MSIPTQKESDIFAAFEKIASQTNLIKEAAVVEEKEDKKKDPDLLDQAHPETVVVAPAYDAMNGVVENLKERQNIMIYIAQKTPRVFQTGSRYVKAQEDLLNETIRLGFLLDSRKEGEMAKIADSCSNQITKEASPLLIGLGLAAIFGGGMLWSNRNPAPQNLKQDIQKALEEIEEAVDDYAQIGPQIAPFVAKVKNLESAINTFNLKMDDVSKKIVELTSTGKPEEKAKKLNNIAVSVFKGGLDKNLRAAKEEISEHIYEVLAATPEVRSILVEARSKYEGADSSVMKHLKDAWYWVAGSDTDDAVEAIEVLSRSATQYLKTMERDIAKLDSLKEQVDNSPIADPNATIKDKVEKSKRNLPDWA